MNKTKTKRWVTWEARFPLIFWGVILPVVFNGLKPLFFHGGSEGVKTVVSNGGGPVGLGSPRRIPRRFQRKMDMQFGMLQS